MPLVLKQLTDDQRIGVLRAHPGFLSELAERRFHQIDIYQVSNRFELIGWRALRRLSYATKLC